jgi:hypothetical protein
VDLVEKIGISDFSHGIFFSEFFFIVNIQNFPLLRFVPFAHLQVHQVVPVLDF